MAWIAGADGCRSGWIRAARETATGALRFDLVERAERLLAQAPRPALLAIDIPIGLTEAGPRACDVEARRLLGSPRRSSVFPAPVRPALAAASREEASRLTASVDGRRVGAQAWGIYPKIREVDALLRAHPEARRRMREVHPELAFWAWAGGRAMRAGKRSPEGRRERLRLVEAWLGRRPLREARARFARSEVADDDLLDALAALWTAARIHAGRARTVPAEPPRDAEGLRMKIVY
jgi:predicted RNase H-like nuclease